MNFRVERDAVKAKRRLGIPSGMRWKRRGTIPKPCVGLADPCAAGIAA